MTPAGDSVFERFRSLVVEALGVDEDEVVMEASFEDDLNVDPVDLADLLVAAEEHFDVHILDSDLQRIRSVGDAVEYLEDKLRT